MKSSHIRFILNNCLGKSPFRISKVCAFNELPKYVETCNRPALFIVNSDPSNLPGSHWIVMYIDVKNAYFFDPLGHHPNKYDRSFKEFLAHNSTSPFSYNFNSNQLQHSESHSCGYYCTYFAMLLSIYPSNPDIVLNQMLHLSEFAIVSHVVFSWNKALLYCRNLNSQTVVM